MHLFIERNCLHTKRGTNVQQEKFMVFAERTTNKHPTTKTDLPPIPTAPIISEPIPKQSVCCCGTLGIKGLLVVGCVMSWAAAAAVRRGESVEECGDWRGEGWVHGDSRGAKWGKGGDCPKREKGSHTVCQSHTTWANAKCLPVTAQSVKQVIILRRDTW